MLIKFTPAAWIPTALESETTLDFSLISACPTPTHFRALITHAIIQKIEGDAGEPLFESPDLYHRRLHALFNDSRPPAAAGSGQVPQGPAQALLDKLAHLHSNPPTGTTSTDIEVALDTILQSIENRTPPVESLAGTASPCPPTLPAPKALPGWAWELKRLHYLLEQEQPKWDHQAELRAAADEAFEEGLESAKEDALSAIRSLREWIGKNPRGLTGEALMAELDQRILELEELGGGKDA